MTIRTILLAADVEPESRLAIDYAFELGEKLGAVVHAVHAYPVVVVPTESGQGNIPYQALHEAARAKLLAALTHHRASPSLGKCVVDLGDPVTVINETAAALSADLIIVGTHALKGMQRLLLGSVAEGILHEARVPVLVIKTPRLRPARTKPEAAHA